ncbi:hypothetical protein BZG36_05319 [Bifiguratus adelaidae]|uniref:Uncharacterized protein n=1 Tax=Bifiguratus adelaidae TaxID=1938954 RepID=A0A261XUQ9_9FUNG|nr:hypothetical protein BZG36_05319 [Bifiguratus adelaidae]
MTSTRTLSHKDYTVGWICALPIEMAAAKVMLDEVHKDPPVQSNDHNAYTLGRVGSHNIVIACLPNGEYGIASAVTVAMQLLASFYSIRFGLLVGIGGGVPNMNADIRLGDIVVGKPTGIYGGVVQYDYGKALDSCFEQTGMLNRPPQVILTALAKLQANHLTEESQIPKILSEITVKLGHKAFNFTYPGREDKLYQADYDHIAQAKTCELCDKTKVVLRAPRDSIKPVIRYGLIASGNQVVKNSHLRDRLGQELGIYCVEMEAAGLMNNFPCLVIRGVCDYADSHKNKEWQGYAAAVAAAFAKELLLVTAVNSIDSTPTASDSLSDSADNTFSFGVARFRVPLDLSNIPAIDQFIGRDEDLDQLWNVLRPAASAMKESGCAPWLHKDDLSAIFWLNGKSQETLMRSLAAFLPKLPDTHLSAEPKTEEEIKEQARQVLQWLAATHNSKWLLMFDNVDKYSAKENLDDEAYDITSFFPSIDHGSIIITTRVPQLTELGRSYPVQKLDSDDAVTLLMESAGLAAEITKNLSPLYSDILSLTHRLDGLPLAIVIAGSYMQQTGISPSKYLELYSQSWGDLQKDAQPHRYYSNGNLVATWMISYQELQKKAPYAARLLLLLACCDNQDIWYELIHRGLQNNDDDPPWLYEVASSEIEFSSAMQALLSLSLIQSKPASSSYSLHPVVQDWCQDYMQEEDNEDELMAIVIISTVFSVTDSNEPQYWISQQRVLPHADRMFQVLRNRGFLSQYPIILDAVNNLGVLFRDQGKLQEAEEMYQRALAGKEKALDLDHSSVNSLST